MVTILDDERIEDLDYSVLVSRRRRYSVRIGTKDYEAEGRTVLFMVVEWLLLLGNKHKQEIDVRNDRSLLVCPFEILERWLVKPG